MREGCRKVSGGFNAGGLPARFPEGFRKVSGRFPEVFRNLRRKVSRQPSALRPPLAESVRYEGHRTKHARRHGYMYGRPDTPHTMPHTRQAGSVPWGTWYHGPHTR